jgi:hypothetical protein
MAVDMLFAPVCFMQQVVGGVALTLCEVHKGIRTTGADFVTNDYHKNNIDLAVETVVDKISFEERNGQLQATSVVLVDKTGAKRTVKARKEIIVSGGNASAGRPFAGRD